MNKKTIYFLLLKILGVAGFIAAIVGIVLAVRGFSDLESNNFMIGNFLAVLGIGAGFFGITCGCAPEIAKAKAKFHRYVQEESKEDLTAIASNTADIMSDAVTTTARAVSDGLHKTIFCKHCGKEIDFDSKYCSACGKEQ